MLKSDRPFTCLFAGAALAVALLPLLATASPKESPAMSFADARAKSCGTVALSPVAERSTIAAAMRDAASIVSARGCVNIRYRVGLRPDIHLADLAR